jgi:hypothetical protein
VYKLTIAQETGYLHAIVTGTNSEDTVRGYMAEIVRECVSRNCLRVLIEEHLEGPRLGTLAVFQLVSQGSERLRGKLRAIAYVDANAADNLMQFASDIAVNRGVPLAVFASVSEAKAWLSKG